MASTSIWLTVLATFEPIVAQIVYESAISPVLDSRQFIWIVDQPASQIIQFCGMRQFWPEIIRDPRERLRSA